MEKENKKINNSPLEIAREDHSKILKIMHRWESHYLHLTKIDTTT
jgi:hypothetical protein